MILLLLVPYSCSWAVSVFHFNFDIVYKSYSTHVCWIHCFKILFSFRFMYFACLWTRCMQYLRRPEKGTEAGVTDGATKWVLGSKARSSARALSPWVTSPGPPPLCVCLNQPRINLKLWQMQHGFILTGFEFFIVKSSSTIVFIIPSF